MPEYTYEIDDNLGITIKKGDIVVAFQPFDPETGEKFTSEKATEWANDFVNSRNIIIQKEG